jgi:signal transduction histidine kinase
MIAWEDRSEFASRDARFVFARPPRLRPKGIGNSSRSSRENVPFENQPHSAFAFLAAVFVIGAALAVSATEQMTGAAANRFEWRLTAGRLAAAIVAALLLLGSVTFLDEERGAEASFADYAAEQARVAQTAAAALAVPLDGQSALSGLDDVLRAARLRLRALEEPGDVIVFVRPPGMKSGLLTLDGVLLSSAPIEAKVASNAGSGAWVRLNHPEAVAIGLPSRTAVAGLASIDRPEGRWELVVAATARRERDREERGLWRVALGFVMASVIVLTFGTLALRKQRTELELARRLAVAEAVQARDERLVRADKLATLGALATGIAHQVSTPLSVIVGRAERLAPRVADDEKARRSVSVIAEQAQRINGIVRGFLGLARGGTPSLEQIHPSQLARGAVEFVEHRFEKSGVSLCADIAEDLPTISCDPRLFEQVIVNLLLNACDACARDGEVILRVCADAAVVAFLVEDDGCGITEEAARRATEPFFTTKAPGEGAGLGLAIASEIVNHHHGTLTLEPLNGRGTRARVEVPAIGPERVR